MIALVATAVAIATPLAPARTRLDCPWSPIFFERAQHVLPPAGRWVVANYYRAVLDASGGEITIVLRTYTREDEATVISGVSDRRAEAVRSTLVEQGISADRILVAHEHRDGPDLAEGWTGGWVCPEFYATPISPPDWSRQDRSAESASDRPMKRDLPKVCFTLGSPTLLIVFLPRHVRAPAPRAADGIDTRAQAAHFGALGPMAEW